MDKEDFLLKQAKIFNDNEEYKETIKLLEDSALENFNNNDLYIEKAFAFIKIGLYKRSEIYLKKVLLNNPNNARALNCYGIVASRKNDIELAIRYYSKAIEVDNEYVAAIYNLGLAYSSLKDYETALTYYQKAIHINTSYVAAINAAGSAYNRLGMEDKALEYYNLAIKTNQKFPSSYYNRALILENQNLFARAIADFKKYIELSKDKNRFTLKYSKNRILELKKLMKSSEYIEISELIKKIKSLLLFKEGCITHYTSLSVAKKLILNDKTSLRLSEGSFLNDTSEGRELFNYLNFHNFLQKGNGNITIAEKFSQKPFIGSFVAEIKHDDLTLWRMYGKEEKEEAKGCALTINMSAFIDKLNNKISSNNSTNENDNSKPKSLEDFFFYRVAYRKQNGFIISGASQKEIENFNVCMKELTEKIDLFKNKRGKKSEEDVQNILKLLNEIAFLFKSDEYRFENEIRLVINGIGFDKTVDENFQPPKVYINLVSIRSLITKITLGPKVEKADEWAASFYYNLDKNNYYPEILISHLPFK